jgi:hypothetical protein
MSKVIVAKTATDINGALNTWFFNEAISRSDVTKTTVNGNQEIEGSLNLSILNIGDILAESGEVYGHLMAIQAPIAILELDVPFGLPKNVYFDGAAKPFRAWFSYGAEAWIKDDQSEIIFYTNPFAGNEDLYLKGSEIKVINDLQTVEALSIEEAEAETASGWTKI